VLLCFGDSSSEDKYGEAQMTDSMLSKVYDLLRGNISMSAINVSSEVKLLLDKDLYISPNGILCRTSPEGR
jgi:hypothetical protein